MQTGRIIGKYEGTERGPLLVCFGGMHGNETAGVQALELIFKMLEMEPKVNPGFVFKGKMIGLLGNKKALERNMRFIEKDLNRQWEAPHIKSVLGTRHEDLPPEDRELKEILEIIHDEIEVYQPEKMIVLDLHTTSAFGGIFAIVNDDPESLQIGAQLHAPVVKGMLRGIKGTTLHYFVDANFPVRTVAVSFEAGQHDEPLSVNRSIAAVINCLRTVGCVKPADVENRHDQLLIDFSKNLPKVNELVTTHHIREEDNFSLLPGFRNFQKVQKGQLLGYDKNGEILSPEDGLILMPRYQQQGEDGYFLIRESAS